MKEVIKTIVSAIFLIVCFQLYLYYGEIQKLNHYKKIYALQLYKRILEPYVTVKGTYKIPINKDGVEELIGTDFTPTFNESILKGNLVFKSACSDTLYIKFDEKIDTFRIRKNVECVYWEDCKPQFGASLK